MAIPSFQDFMLPLLELLQDGKAHKISEVREELAEYFNITEDEKKILLPSGRQEVYKNRIGWARAYLYNAGLIERLDRGVYKITERGLEVLKEKPSRIDVNYLMKFPEFREFKGAKDKELSQLPDSQIIEQEQETPLEILGKMYQVIREQLAKEILERIMQNSPEFFEKLIIDLLQAMGYGGSLEDAGSVTKKTSDEGIDGIIKEDKLGLDVIYIQAKRWSSDRLVGRPEIQKFVGALAGFGAKKGIFVTTSDFTKEAREYIPKTDTKIVLINGQMLANLMIEYNVGVSVDIKYEIKKIDNDYFDEE
jgi:restriction system protein